MDKKLVSYCLFTYNQEDYIREAMEGAVKQTYSPLEIVISDDGSKDNTFKIIEEFKQNYSGPHKIIINQNKINMGIGGHFSHVLYEIASGAYLVVLGGDDISTDKHVEKAVNYLEENPDVSMVDFNAQIINEQGKIIRKHQQLDFDKKKFVLDDYLKFKTISSFAPGRIFNRAVLESFDPISKNCPTEDSVLVLRSLLINGLMRIDDDLVYYRIHSNNVSGAGNLFKLSHLAIISQYIIDALKLFNDKQITEKEAEIVLERINIEYRLRKLRYIKYENVIQKISGILYYRLVINLTRFKYRFLAN